MVSERSKAILLLTAYLPGSGKGGVKPLSTGEYNRLARWINNKGLSPEQLLAAGLRDQLSGWGDKTVGLERIEKLLARGGALAISLDKWESAGMWVLNRGDENYPSLVKEQLKESCPPIFFGCGNAKLLATPSIGVVGSRKATEADLEVTKQFGKLISDEGFSVVSGAAKGVDETSMLGALESGGTAIGMVADSLLKLASSRKYRDYLIRKDLVLISPFYPEARFNVGNAMGRNKLIYTQSKATVVIHSGLTGGTIAGAEENLRREWVPLWVKKTDDPEAGNELIESKGGSYLPEEVGTWMEFILKGQPEKPKPIDLFSQSEPEQQQVDQEIPDPIFDYFLEEVRKIAAGQEVESSQLSSRLGLVKEQTMIWLEKAEKQGLMVKKKSGDTYLVNP